MQPAIQNKHTGEKKIQRRYYVIVFLLIAISGNPLLVYSTEWMYIIYASVLIFYLSFIKKLVVSVKSLKWIGCFIVLFIAQYFLLDQVSIPADANFIAKFSIAFLSVWFCQDRFCEIYLKVMYWICVISLFFFILKCIQIPIPGFTFDRYITIGIWNYINGNDSFRNCGMFWEPGAFQGFIILTFLLYIPKLKWLWKNRRKQVVVLSLALLSTFSTTAYIVAFTFISLVLLASRINVVYKVCLVLFALIAATYAYSQLDFMGRKIQDELQYAEKTGTKTANWSRTGAMYIEIENILRHPVIGNGFLLESRYKGLGLKMIGTGNGFTGMINMLGIPIMIAYLIGIFHSWGNTRVVDRFIVVVVLIMLLFGEYFLNYPLFWGLLFVRIPNQTKKVGQPVIRA